MDNTPQTADTPEDEIHLLDYLLVLAKHSRMIITNTLVVMIVTLAILLLIPNKYSATARLLPPQQSMTLSAQIMDTLALSSTPGGSGGGGLGGMAASMLGLKSPGDLYVGILTGNTIFDGIIDKFDLRNYYNSSFATKGLYIEDARKELEKRSNISAGKDGLISVEITDEDPRLAAEMANAFVAELDKLLQKVARKEAQDNLAFLEKERFQTNQNLAKAEEALRGFSEQSSVLQIDAQTRGMLEYIANLRATIDAKEVQIKVMQQQATPYNYDVKRLETELKGLQEKLRDAETQASQTCSGSVCLPTSKVPALGMEYFRLVREAKYQEAIYQMYCKLVELARLDSARDVAVLQVLDMATPPEKKSKPKRLLMTLLIGIVTFFFMVFYAFFREYALQMQQNKAEADRLLSLKAYLQPYKAMADKIMKILRLKK